MDVTILSVLVRALKGALYAVPLRSGVRDVSRSDAAEFFGELLLELKEFVPRLIGQLVSYLPLVDVAVPYALAGAGIAALCALFIYHAMDGWALVTGSRQVRVFVAVALIMGFVEAVFAATVVPYVSGQYSYNWEGGSRYSTMPIMTMTAAAVVAVDAYLRRQAMAEGGDRIPLVRRSPWAVTAVVALVCVLALGWLSDYRYVTERTSPPWGQWKPTAEHLLTACEHSTSGDITTWTWGRKTITIPCSRLHR
jgi:hypothetical protein